MSNRFYNFVNQLIAGSVAKSSEVNSELQGADLGFSAVQDELNTAIKLPASESATDQRLTDTPAQRAGKMLGFTAAGAVTETNAFLADFSMGGFRLRNLLEPVDADEPVTLSYLQAYSTGLIAGFPTITGQDGPLITNGSTVSWGAIGRLVPTAAFEVGGETLFYQPTANKAVYGTPNANACFDPNGVLGTGYWDTSLDTLSNSYGPHWTSAAGLTTATFDHKPTATIGEIACSPGASVCSSVNLYTGGTSAGTITLVHRYYDAAHALLSEDATTRTITMANSNERKYTLTTNAPASTAYVVAALKFAGVTCSAYGIRVRNMKVENASYPTPFDDYKTLAIAYGNASATYFGSGFTTPKVAIGDASSTSSSLDLRSAAGAQAYDAQIKSTGGTGGTAGKGAVAIDAKSVTFSGIAGHPAEYDAGNSGAAITINFATNGQFQRVTLNSATPAITIAVAGLVVGKYQLKVLQDGTGGRLPTWAGFNATDCVGGSFPVMGAGAGAVTFVSLYWDGSQFWVSSNAWDA